MKIFHKETLPQCIPLLPLHGAVLLPRAQLPVPVFEADYLSMIADCLKGDQIIGVVQPILKELNFEGEVPLFQAGCAGKIIDISEMEENQLVMTLRGVCRFNIVEELSQENGYRKAYVSYERYTNDMVDEVDFSFDRKRLLIAVEGYFRALDITPNWQEIGKTSNEKLITALAMVCPFEAREKQALLEAPSLKEQSQVMTTMIEIAILENTQQKISCH